MNFSAPLISLSLLVCKKNSDAAHLLGIARRIGADVLLIGRKTPKNANEAVQVTILCSVIKELVGIEKARELLPTASLLGARYMFGDAVQTTHPTKIPLQPTWDAHRSGDQTSMVGLQIGVPSGLGQQVKPKQQTSTQTVLNAPPIIAVPKESKPPVTTSIHTVLSSAPTQPGRPLATKTTAPPQTRQITVPMVVDDDDDAEDFRWE